MTKLYEELRGEHEGLRMELGEPKKELPVVRGKREDRCSIAGKRFVHSMSGQAVEPLMICHGNGKIHEAGRKANLTKQRSDAMENVCGRTALPIEKARRDKPVRRGTAAANRQGVEWNPHLQRGDKEIDALSYSIPHDLRTFLRRTDIFSRSLLWGNAGTDTAFNFTLAVEKCGPAGEWEL